MATPSIEAAAMRYYRARKALQQAKEALKAYREKHGGCDYEGEDNGPYEPKGICYHETKDQNDWCETCTGSESLFQAKRRAAIEQGAALRALVAICSREEIQIETEPEA